MPYTEIAFSSFTAYVLAVMALQQAGFLHTNEWHGGAIPKGVESLLHRVRGPVANDHCRLHSGWG